MNQHVASYRLPIHQWEAGDFSRHLPIVLFPGEQLHAYAGSHFKNLKAKQAHLLNM